MSKRIEDKREENTAVAIDKNKGSQYALKWAIDRLLSRGQTLTLVHVKQKSSSVAKPSGNVASADVNNNVARTYKQEVDTQTKELFLPFRCFCSRKDIKCNEVTLEDTDIAKSLIEYASLYAIDNLVLGASSRNTLIKKFRATDIPSSVSKGAPSFCNVYVIAKGKISSVRSATTPPPAKDHVRSQSETQLSLISDPTQSPFMHNQKHRANMTLPQSHSLQELLESNSPLTSERASVTKHEPSTADSDLSFMSSGSPSIGRKFPSFSDTKECGRTSQLSISSDSDISSFMSSSSGNRQSTSSSQHDFSSSAGSGSWSSQSLNMAEDVEEEMRRLRLELKQTIEMYGAACKEAISAKHKARELHHWKLEDQQRLHEARLAEEAALALAEKEKARCKAAMEEAESAQKIAELEAQKRNYIEMSALKAEVEENQKALSALTHSDLRYRKYTIEEIEEATEYFASSLKIGEGGYGPVYKCFVDYTPAAVKVLRPDAAHGRSQFQQEVEILCNIRHPNMVILLGACPEYGCLVYEYMGNGSLEDRLFRRGGTPVLPWQLRFRIAAEISTGLLFLHQTKPEPLVHRDLKPANILLDRNYVSKISDVGLARLVPPSVADSVTQYRMTSAAGTFCYIDPEYQQTGMLGIKSDIYALGIMLLQIITAKPPMGLTHLVQRAIDQGSFDQVLDPAVPDWPVEEALGFAKLALQCAELRRKDRPDLGTVVLPELKRLAALAHESMPTINHLTSPGSSPIYSQVSTAPQDLDDTESLQSGYASSRSRDSSILSFTERLT